MAYNYGLGSRGSIVSSNSSKGASTGGEEYGRVVDIILDSSHPKYAEYGKSQSLNGIFYRKLDREIDETKKEELYFAYSGTSTFKILPLLGEIVSLYSGPSEDIGGVSIGRFKKYYRATVNIWNHPHHNGYPDLEQNPGDIELGYEVKEKATIAPLQSFPGDTIWEGRYGQSLRFSGTQHSSNPLSTSSNNGKPFTLLVNGRKETGDGYGTSVESIDEDDTSLYLVSDHVVPLTPANTKRDSYNSPPEKSNVFRGKQAVVNADRIYLNARKDSLLLSAKISVGINAQTVNIDGVDYMALDAKQIFLGKKARAATGASREPVVLGKQNDAWLKDLLAVLDTLAKGLSSLPPAPAGAVAKLIATGAQLTPRVAVLKQQLPKLLSKKVFTE